MLKDKYVKNDIEISPNYYEGWNHKEEDFIFLNCDTTEEFDNNNGITLDEAKFIRDALDEIIKYKESQPKIRDYVMIVSGRFSGSFGTITDIDKCDTKRPLEVKLNDCLEYNNCTCFVDYSDVKKCLKV